jgi:hypothetical protein
MGLKCTRVSCRVAGDELVITARTGHVDPALLAELLQTESYTG